MTAVPPQLRLTGGPPVAPSRSLDPLRLALGLWIALALAAGVRTLIRPDSHTVFPIFATSASHWWSDQSLYDEYRPLDFFRYPPVFPVLVTPCSVLGLCAGGIAWTWLGILVYLAGLWCFARDVAPGEWTRRRLALFLALGALGGLRGLWNAQSNALVVGLLLLAGSAVVRGRWWTAASLLAGSVWVKLTPLAVALLFCGLWPRRLLPRLAIALLVGGLVPFLTRPPAIVLGHYQEWLGHLLASSGERWPGNRDGWTCWLVARWLVEGGSGPFAIRAPIDTSWYRLTQVMSAGLALLWCLWQQRRGASTRQLVYLTLGIGTAWLMFFGPAVEHATYVFLAPSLIAALLDRSAWPRGRVLIVSAALLVLVLGWGALTRPLQDRFPPVLALLPLGTGLYALFLVGCAGWGNPLPAQRGCLRLKGGFDGIRVAA